MGVENKNPFAFVDFMLLILRLFVLQVIEVYYMRYCLFSLIPFILFSVCKTYGQNDTIYLKAYNLKAVGKYVNGKKNGPWVYFYHNNQVQSKGNYSKGILTGLWVNWYNDGTKAAEGFYNNNHYCPTNISSHFL